jgi:hypothetical protein
MLVEIQALVDSGGPSPRRLSVGLDRDRLAMLLAVLHRHAGVACMDQDVFVNAVGGVRISEPAADLAVMLAITSQPARQGAAQGLHRLWRGGAGRRGAPRAARSGTAEGRPPSWGSVAVVPKANAPKAGAGLCRGRAGGHSVGLFPVCAGLGHRHAQRPPVADLAAARGRLCRGVGVLALWPAGGGGQQPADRRNTRPEASCAAAHGAAGAFGHRGVAPVWRLGGARGHGRADGRGTG